VSKKKGQAEYNKFKEGKLLTRKQAIMAQCFICNGEESTGVDCQGSDRCPLYQYFPYKRRLSAMSKADFPC
jgi:hypothetical protein